MCALKLFWFFQDKEGWCEWRIFTLNNYFEWHSGFFFLQKQGLGFSLLFIFISESFLFLII